MLTEDGNGVDCQWKWCRQDEVTSYNHEMNSTDWKEAILWIQRNKTFQKFPLNRIKWIDMKCLRQKLIWIDKERLSS